MQAVIFHLYCEFTVYLCEPTKCWISLINIIIALSFFFTRPRKVVPCANKTFVSGEDPYLVDCVSEKLFPQLSLENCGKSTNCSPSYGSNSTMLQVVTIREGDKCINLPSLSIEQNYSQMLSELVMHI